MNLTDIRQAIADVLTYGDLVATPRIPTPSEITCPHAFISDMALRQTAMDETVDVDITVTVLASLANLDDGWQTVSDLWDMDSDDGIVAAITSDRKLDGTAAGLTFGELRALGNNYDAGGVLFLGFQMAFTVHV